LGKLLSTEELEEIVKSVSSDGVFFFIRWDCSG
jgi:hypothetical protein